MRAIELARLVYEKCKEYFDNGRLYAKRIKEIAREALGEAEVYVFGSILRGEAHPMLSDVDILIVSRNAPSDNDERARIMARIKREIGELNPFEIHMATPREYEWYKRFIDRIEVIE